MKVINHLNLNYKQLKNAVIEKLATAPTTGLTEGLVYYNTTSNAFFIYRGSSAGWSRLDSQSMTASDILSALTTVDGAGTSLDADLLDGQHGAHYLNRENHTGSQTANTISNLETTVKGYTLNSFAAPTGSVGLNSQKITGLADPADNTQEAATANWVQSKINNAVQGLDIKASVKVVSTSTLNGTYDSSGASGVGTYTLTGSAATNSASFDSITLIVGNRVIIKNASNDVHNGFYEVTEVTPNLVFKRVDATQGQQINAGSFAFVENGTTFASTGWVMNAVGSVGTAVITFYQFSSAGVITAGVGLAKSGNTLSINTSFVATKVVGDVPSGSTTASITHNLNTQDISVTIREVATNEIVLADVVVNNANSCSIVFETAPTSGQYRYIIVG
jgi:hypothetical protein